MLDGALTHWKGDPGQVPAKEVKGELRSLVASPVATWEPRHSALSCSDSSSCSSLNFYFYVFAVLKRSCLICQLLIRELIRDLMPGKVASLTFVSYQLQCYLPLSGFE